MKEQLSELLGEESVEHELFLISLIEAGRDVFLVIDPRGRIQSANRAVHHMFGYFPYELTGIAVEQLFSETDQAALETSRSRAVESSERSQGSVGQRLTARTKDGRLLPVSLRWSAANLGHEAILFGIIRDVTGVLDSETALRRHSEGLGEVNAELETLAATTAYDLHEPLDSIESSIGFLRSDGAEFSGLFALLEAELKIMRNEITNGLSLASVRQPETVFWRPS